MIKLIMVLFLTLLSLLLVFFSQPSLSQENEKTKQFELENGLKVFLYERHSVPLINLAFAVNCGSKDETEITSGIVHILEHYIMFRGTEFRSGEELAQDIREHGAYFNAHTSRDLVYFEMTLPSENGDFGLSEMEEKVRSLYGDLTNKNFSSVEFESVPKLSFLKLHGQ